MNHICFIKSSLTISSNIGRSFIVVVKEMSAKVKQLKQITKIHFDNLIVQGIHSIFFNQVHFQDRGSNGVVIIY